MLVLSRKKNETIQIGDAVIVTVVQVKGKGVRIGIEAPDNVRILRGELNGHPNVETDELPEAQIAGN